MGCRTYIGYDINGLGWQKDGRGNAFPTTIILPTIAMEALQEGTDLPEQGIIELFMRKFADVMNDAKNSLIDRYKYACSRKPISANFMYENNVVAGYDGKTIESAMKHMTLGIGIIGLVETLQLLIGCNHLTEKGMNLAKKICKFHFDKCSEYKERYHLNFSSYHAPAESLCYTAMCKFRDRYGIIKDVSDKEYFTNSIHVPVWEEIDPFTKIDTESQLSGYSRAGTICYVELESNCQHNVKALEKIVEYAMDKDIPYFAINVPNATCKDCGYDMFDADFCPSCGSNNVMRLARVTGYLSTDYRHFNKGKQAEVNDRFKHTKKIEWTPIIPK